MEECCTGQSSLSQFYLDHWQTLRTSLIGRVGSRDLADEAMQETWLRLTRITAPPEGVANERSYLLGIAGNIAIDLIRREKRHLDRAAPADFDLDRLIDDSPSAEDVLLAREELRQLVRALLLLSEKARSVLLMGRCLGMGHRDIAATMGISESMVAKYMAQALRHCRDHLRQAV